MNHDVKFGVRQSSVLSPFLFALYLDDIWNYGKLISSSYMSSYMLTIFYSSRRRCVSCSVLLMLVSVNLCDLIWLLIEKKSCCIRIGPRNDYVCANITTRQGYTVYRGRMKYVILVHTLQTVDNLGVDRSRQSLFFVLPT